MHLERKHWKEEMLWVLRHRLSLVLHCQFAVEEKQHTCITMIWSLEIAYLHHLSLVISSRQWLKRNSS